MNIFELNNIYMRTEPVYKAIKTLYTDRGYLGRPINWDEYGSEQVMLYTELTNLKYDMDNICYQALEILPRTDIDHFVEQYRMWVGRINTIESNYMLIDSYLETKEFQRAREILWEMPFKFRNMSEEDYLDYRTYLDIAIEYYSLGENIEMPPHLADQLMILTRKDNHAGVKSFALGELLMGENWTMIREPAFYQVNSNCITAIMYSPFHKSASNENSSKDINRIETEEMQQIDIFPNPANNTLFIKLSHQPERSIYYNLYDIQGKQLIKGDFNEQKNEIDISHISKGIYFIAFTIENQTRIVRKIIKE
jgi:hypothetical protein